ncbi:MAG: hypothetical protein JST92_14905 [Deltaproteobacteria bacterium]|nr:hypothetical protein [Deltaproteobacteria bacterium]
MKKRKPSRPEVRSIEVRIAKILEPQGTGQCPGWSRGESHRLEECRLSSVVAPNDQVESAKADDVKLVEGAKARDVNSLEHAS